MKRKILKALSSLFMAAVLMTGPVVPAQAGDTSVRYDGGAEKFVFLPGNDSSTTELFDNLKNVICGQRRIRTMRALLDRMCRMLYQTVFP